MLFCCFVDDGGAVRPLFLKAVSLVLMRKLMLITVIRSRKNLFCEQSSKDCEVLRVVVGDDAK